MNGAQTQLGILHGYVSLENLLRARGVARWGRFAASMHDPPEVPPCPRGDAIFIERGAATRDDNSSGYRPRPPRITEYDDKELFLSLVLMLSQQHWKPGCIAHSIRSAVLFQGSCEEAGE